MPIRIILSALFVTALTSCAVTNPLNSLKAVTKLQSLDPGENSILVIYASPQTDADVPNAYLDIDGRQVGTIGVESRHEFSLTPGEHVIHIKRKPFLPPAENSSFYLLPLAKGEIMHLRISPKIIGSKYSVSGTGSISKWFEMDYKFEKVESSTANIEINSLEE